MNNELMKVMSKQNYLPEILSFYEMTILQIISWAI